MALVQSAKNSSGATAVASLAQAFGSNNTAGNLLIAVADIDWGGGIPAVSIADSLGNTWIQPTGFETNPDVSDTAIWYCWNCKGGANTVTMTVLTATTGGNVNVAMTIREYSGVQSSSNPLDKFTIANGNSSAASSGATAATTNANELVIGIVTSEQPPGDTYTVGSGYGNLYMENDAALPHESIMMEDKTVSSTGAQTATATLQGSSFWVAAVMTFILASSTPALPPGEQRYMQAVKRGSFY